MALCEVFCARAITREEWQLPRAVPLPEGGGPRAFSASNRNVLMAGATESRLVLGGRWDLGPDPYTVPAATPARLALLHDVGVMLAHRLALMMSLTRCLHDFDAL